MESSKDTKNIKKGFPLGIKVNDEDLIEGLTLEALIEITKVYHGDHYVIGHDTLYCQKPHYHIHFYSVKDTSVGAMKTFRSNVIKKKFPHISKSFRFYTGQDLEGVNPALWLAYCIKENLVSNSMLEITDEIRIQAKAQLQVKQLKDVHSQKKAIEQKEKQDFKEKMLEYVRHNYLDYIKQYPELETKYGNISPTVVRRLIIKHLVQENKFGSIKKHILQQYVLEYLVKNGEFTEADIEKFIGF